MQHAARHREVRIERAFADLDGELGNIDAIGRSKNRGTLRLALRDRPCKHVGRQPVDRRARSGGARLDTDHPAIIRSRCHVLRLGGENERLREKLDQIRNMDKESCARCTKSGFVRCRWRAALSVHWQWICWGCRLQIIRVVRSTTALTVTSDQRRKLLTRAPLPACEV